MDCKSAREWMAMSLAEESSEAETLRIHLSQCPCCRAECEAWGRTWLLLGTWGDKEVPARLDRVVLAEVGAPAEIRGSWLRRLASGRAWAAAVGATVLTIAASLLVPYEASLRICGRALADAGLVIPALPLAFLVGLPYAVVPLLVVAALWLYLGRNGQKMQGFTVGQAFAVMMVPYILFACGDLEVIVIAGILLGTVTGALGGGAASQWLMRPRPAGTQA